MKVTTILIIAIAMVAVVACSNDRDVTPPQPQTSAATAPTEAPVMEEPTTEVTETETPEPTAMMPAATEPAADAMNDHQNADGDKMTGDDKSSDQGAMMGDGGQDTENKDGQNDQDKDGHNQTPEPTAMMGQDHDADQDQDGMTMMPNDEPDAIVSTLTDVELSCLPERPSTDQDLFMAMDEYENPYNNPVANCLTPDQQFMVYLKHAQMDGTADDFDIATHRCIWDGTAPLLQHLPTSPNGDMTDQPGLEQTMAMMMIPVMVMAYCASDMMPELQDPSGMPHPELEYIKCLIDYHEGPAQFTKSLVENPEDMEAAIRPAEQHCESLKPATMPGPTPGS